MTNHTVWGHASDALYTLHTKNAADMEYAPDEPIRSQFVLGLFNAAGDGIALGGTRRELLTYLRTAIEHIERETDPRGSTRRCAGCTRCASSAAPRSRPMTKPP